MAGGGTHQQHEICNYSERLHKDVGLKCAIFGVVTEDSNCNVGRNIEQFRPFTSVSFIAVIVMVKGMMMMMMMMMMIIIIIIIITIMKMEEKCLSLLDPSVLNCT
jgi:hypothetical protein